MRKNFLCQHGVVKEKGDGGGCTKSIRRGIASANITFGFCHKVLVLRVTCIVQEHLLPHFSVDFSVNSSAIPYCPLVKSVSRTQMSAARRDLDWSAALARLPFDGDDAFLHNTVPMPSCCGHRSLPAAVACFLCGQTLSHKFGDYGVARRA
jgi:hypothetical protein